MTLGKEGAKEQNVEINQTVFRKSAVGKCCRKSRKVPYGVATAGTEPRLCIKKPLSGKLTIKIS